MRPILKLTVLALVFVVTVTLGTFVPIHQAAANPAVVTEFSQPFFRDNPCTPGNDNITGTIIFRVVVHEHPGELTDIKLNQHGQGTDSNGLKYQIRQSSHFQEHDPLPLTIHTKEKIVSQTGVDNFEVDGAVHINEQGEVTKVDLQNEECKG